jgi:hypothetical protein
MRSEMMPKKRIVTKMTMLPLLKEAKRSSHNATGDRIALAAAPKEPPGGSNLLPK